jgi:tetratricopeptide (TPR) repeat protein
LGAELARELGDPRNEMELTSYLGVGFAQLDNFDSALPLLRQVAEHFRQSGNVHHEAMASHNLGIALEYQRNFEEALEIFRMAIEALDQRIDREGIDGSLLVRRAHALSHFANCLEKTGNYETALDALAEAIDWNCTAGAEVVYLDELLGRIKEILQVLGRSPESDDVFQAANWQIVRYRTLQSYHG